MSFLIKGGYDVFRQQILNIALKRTNIWTQGLITVKTNKFVCGLVPLNENKLEIVKYNNRHALLLNNSIIYEDNKLFTYDIDLQVGSDLFEGVPVDLNNKEFYNFIDYHYVDYPELKRLHNIRNFKS